MEAIVQIAAGTANDCIVFPDLPLADPVHIAFVADAQQEAAAFAVTVHKIMLARFNQLAAAAGRPSQRCGSARLLGCRGRAQPACHSLLVIACRHGIMSPKLSQQAAAWLRRPSSAILAVLPAGASVSSCLPPSLSRINTVSADIGASNVADAVEVASNIRDRQLFISYRRKDTQAIADQLFDAFSRAGWRVFLDRFSGTPSRQFPREIAEELARKGALLVLESPNIMESSWTLAEVAMARRLSLGLFALTLPDSPQLSGIPRRYPIGSPELQPGPQLLLESGVAADIVRFVGQGYLEQSHFRRAVMTARLQLALAGEGMSAMPVPGGGWRVQQTSYVVNIAPRPAGLNDARRGDDSVSTGNLTSVIVGPHRLQPPSRIADIAWLADKLDFRLRGEWQMTQLARDLKRGLV
jgi:hypothetical protein